MTRRFRLLLALATVVAAIWGVAPSPTAAAPADWQGTYTRHTQPADAVSPGRDYLLYVPPTLPPAGQRALVVFLHGCTQSADEVAPGVGFNELADQRGFVVVYPEQKTYSGEPDVDGSSAQCWNAGQSEVAPRFHGELGTVARITQSVAATHGADPTRVYIAGISSGALMASSMAAVYPDLYNAVGSVAGCGYLCADATGDLAHRRMGALARAMPAFIVQGSADYVFNPALGEVTVSQWVGTNDLADDGRRNGSVAPVPAVEHRHLDELESAAPGSGDACLHTFPRNPCPAGALGIDHYPTTIRRYADDLGAGATVVEAWLIHGLSHNYPGGDYAGTFTDPHGPRISEAMFDFFESH